MPRITEERRDARREQILDAARACVQEYGLEAVSMEMIIARSGLSTGAVYRYFKGKGEIMTAAAATGLAGLAEALAPVLANPDPPPPAEFVGQLISTGLGYGLRDPGIDLLQLSIHGWSHIQTDPVLRAAASAAFGGMRDQCAAVAAKWQAAGTVDPGADPAAIAQLIMSIGLGFIAQRALAGGVDPQAHAAALAALTQPAARTPPR
jgi:TetR/AcrR family transcriptional regulator, transcriptional repressor of aconitase